MVVTLSVALSVTSYSENGSYLGHVKLHEVSHWVLNAFSFLAQFCLHSQDFGASSQLRSVQSLCTQHYKFLNIVIIFLHIVLPLSQDSFSVCPS